MKTEDFEKAIDGLNCGVSIKEMKILKGQVRLCFGCTDRMLLMWDRLGRGFALHRVAGEDGEGEEITADTFSNIPVDMYSRDTFFDLKFE